MWKKEHEDYQLVAKIAEENEYNAMKQIADEGGPSLALLCFKTNLSEIYDPVLLEDGNNG